MNNATDNAYEFGDMSCNAFVDLLLSLNEYELTILGCAIGILLIPSTTVNQQNSLGNFFELIGQVLLTASAQAINLQPNGPSRVELAKRIKELEKELEKIKRDCCNNNP